MPRAASVLFAALAAPLFPQELRYLDIAPFGRPLAGENFAGVEWDEERDVREIRVRYAGAPPAGTKLEYWFRNWPYAPPQMPVIEDPVDDPWQGEWLTAQSSEDCRGAECRYTFQPLAAAENPLARNLPGVRYRRTLKVRLAFSGAAPKTSSFAVYTDSRERRAQVRVELAGAAAPRFSVYNGRIVSMRADGNATLVDLIASDPAPPGSNDITVVTVRTADRAFSFSVEDLARGPISVPAFQAVARLAGDSRAVPAGGARIRRMIPREPEQTYERASREIPPLDPWQRQHGDRVYLPLAADSSWQKFAFEYGGSVFISKRGAKAKGRELARLLWSGDRIAFKIGTGATPYFRDDRQATVSKLEGFLPVITQRWRSDGLEYAEEAFATLLRGPLSPGDPGRSEQTPAVLMLRLTAENRGAASRTAHFWLFTEPREPLRISGRRVLAGTALRAVVQPPGGEELEIAEGAHAAYEVPAGARKSLLVKLPFVSDLDEHDADELEALDYDTQRARVVEYWRGIVNPAARFRVPEPKFNDLLRSVVAHIRISATKDPKSGLYMVPAASYNYQVYANETCFQVLLLDALGQSATAREYLETLLRLQGTRNFPGRHTGPPDAILHGARVDETYDYTASNYGLDHGTVLWTLAEHYLYTRDRDWLAHAWPHMRKAIDWIVEQRGATKRLDEEGAKVREYGLLPASHLEDNRDWAHWFSINAFAWAGLDRTAQALADIRHPEAERVRREADACRTDLRAAVLRAVEAAPVRRMRDGTYSPYVPVQPWQRFGLFGPLRVGYYSRYGKPGVLPTFRLSATREVLYGPMMLLNLGVFAADEPIADWILDDWEDNLTLTSGLGLNVHGLTDDRLWFSQGGMVFQANLQNPILAYLKRHEVPAAIRNLYNNFTACLYPEVNVFTEEYRMWRHASGPFYKTPDESRFVNRLRDTLVLENGDELWLAAGAPRRWLESREGIRAEGLMSWFGPVSYTMRAGPGRGVVEAAVRLPGRNPPRIAWLVARTPGGRIRAVTINGRPWTRIDHAREAIELPRGAAPLHIRISY